MTAFGRAAEDRPTPPEVYNWRVYAASLAISMGLLTYGYDSAFIGTTITQKSFKSDFGLDAMTKAQQNAVSSNLTNSAGGFFGAFFMFFSMELLGRKKTAIISDAIFILGAILCTVPTHQLGMIYAGRLLTGLGVGGLAAVSPIYTSEIAPPAIRGRLTGFFESSYQIGAVIGFWINYGVVHNINGNDSKAWRIPSQPRNTELGERTLTYMTAVAVQLIPAGILALMLPLVKESPVWLLKKGRDEDAYRVYSYLRNLTPDHQYIAEDVSFVKGQIESERAISTGSDPSFTAFLKGALKESLMKGIRNRFALVFLMFMWQAWSGAAAINYYSPTIFASIGLTDVTFWTGIYGLIKAAGSVIFLPFSLTNSYYLAGYIAVGKPSLTALQSPSTIAGGKAATAFIMIFGGMWSFGANGLPWIISSEIFPSSLRSISGPFAAMSVWLWTYVVTKALPSMYTSMGYGVYIFFASTLVCASVYAFFFIPETKGLRIDQMDQLFGFTKLESISLAVKEEEHPYTKEDIFQAEVV
ncbi:related to quinate transport protein [Phialocephala subalpina]|uniref:Related to quinate transport protein n=1 Tax=Phialocephala subalpina TaxID=576137 RepID=A0A1L7XU59_9HELO|nr:related to quinate transport protein [Phialocephala subalpina]